MPDSAPAQPPRSLEQVLLDFEQTLEGDTVTVGKILEAFHERGFGVLLFIFAIPLVLIPIPGSNVPFALALVALTAQQVMGAHTPWIPEKLKSTTISCQGMSIGLKKAAFWSQKIEFLLKPRLGWLTQDGPSRIVGGITLILSLFSTIPLPLTNSVPGIGIGLIALGIGMRDGLAILAGAVVGLGWITMLTSVLLFFGPDALHAVKEAILSIF